MRNKRSAQEPGRRVGAGEAECLEDSGSGVATVDVADIERLMEGFREEVQKLDEGLRMLSAYVAGLRKRAHRDASDTLH
jgi:hypothetical protein